MYYFNSQHGDKGNSNIIPFTPEERVDNCFYQIISSLFEDWIDTEAHDFEQNILLCKEIDNAIRESCGYDKFLDRLFDYMKYVIEPALRFNGHRVGEETKLKIITDIELYTEDPEFTVMITLGIVEVDED